MNSTLMMETELEYANPTAILSVAPTYCRNAPCIFFAVSNVIIIVLGVAGNGLVIWIVGFKVKKSVLSTWYLSLAMSDFLFCCILPFGVIYAVKKEWIFGLFMCKFRYFVMFLNMYSSIFLLVNISVDRCVVVMFPVWAQNKRTIRKASAMVILAWIFAAALSSPMAIFHDIFDNHEHVKICVFNFKTDQDEIAVVSSRFVLGFLIPLLIIIACYVVIIRKLKSNPMARSKKPLKVMTVLIATFVICWLPFHTFSFLEMKYYNTFVNVGKLAGVILASANSMLNPFLYAFMGKDFKKQCYAILPKIENALLEEADQNAAQRGACTTVQEHKLSDTVASSI